MFRNSLHRWMTKNNLDPSKTYIWVCFFVNNQYRIIVNRKGNAATSPEELDRIFGEKLAEIGQAIAMLDHWDQPLYLSRIWTIYEQYTCAKMKVPMEMILPEEEEDSMMQAIDQGHDGIEKIKESLSCID